MGFNTTILLINDGFSEFELDPSRFVSEILHHMHDGTPMGDGGFIRVMETAHADQRRLYSSHGNAIVEINTFSQHTQSWLDRADLHDEIQARIDHARSELDKLQRTLDVRKKAAAQE